MLIELVYYSTSSTNISDREVADIVAGSRDNNRAHNVTGMLVFANGYFLQVLEGPPASVKKIFQSIQQDPRHTDIQVICEGEVDYRRFHEWDMGYFGSSAVERLPLFDEATDSSAQFSPGSLGCDVALSLLLSYARS